MHGARWNNARPNRELGGRGIVMQKLDAEPVGGRGEEGGRIAEASPRTRGRVSFADVGSGVVVLYAGPGFSRDKSLWRAGPGGLPGRRGWKRRVCCVFSSWC